MSKTKKLQKTPIFKKTKKTYACEICDFHTSKKTDYFRHLTTKKHKKKENSKNEKNKKNEKKRTLLCDCGREFKTRSGLWKHKKKCNFKQNNIIDESISQNVSNFPSKNSTNLDEEYKKLQIEALKQNMEKSEMEKKLIAIKLKTAEQNLANPKEKSGTKVNIGHNTINTTNNNNISIHMYLNENCKNAMNLEDFVKNISITLQDLDYSKKNGYAEGISNILMKSLGDLKPTERPIHCSDTKRLKFYVKEDDKWAKDCNNHKIDKTLTDIKHQQLKNMNDWEKLHPDFMDNPKLLDEWQMMIKNMAGSGNNVKQNIKQHNKIKKNLSSIVDITPELINK